MEENQEMKGRAISPKLVAAVNLRAATFAIERCREILKYSGPLKIHWFVTEQDANFAATPGGGVYNLSSPYGFVPIKSGEPEIWLHACESPELIASIVFHEFRHVLDVERVAHLEQLSRAVPSYFRDDSWQHWLYRQESWRSEEEAERFQRWSLRETEFIGAAARKIAQSEKVAMRQQQKTCSAL